MCCLSLNKYNILITNDDGIQSPGLNALIDQFSPVYNITVVAPKYPQSAKGMSHAHGDVWVTTTEEVRNGITWISVDNSPTTCTSIALRAYNIHPDIIISGINYGENLGLNMFYSGTVGAAWEGAMSGFLSIASSLELPSGKHFAIDNTVDFSVAAFVTKKVVESLQKQQPHCKLWNLYIPTKATSQTEIKKSNIAPYRWNYPVIREQKNHQKNEKKFRFEFDPVNQTHMKETDINNLRKGFITLSEINSLNFPWQLH